MSTRTATIKALQAALAQEHAAIYGYALLGARLHGKDRETATAHLDEHRRARDALEAQLRAREATPVKASASYTLPAKVTDTGSARALATRLERATLGAYVGLAGAARGSVRRTTIIAMQRAATRQAQWSHTIDTLPGLRT